MVGTIPAGDPYLTFSYSKIDLGPTCESVWWILAKLPQRPYALIMVHLCHQNLERNMSASLAVGEFVISIPTY